MAIWSPSQPLCAGLCQAAGCGPRAARTVPREEVSVFTGNAGQGLGGGGGVGSQPP